MSAKQRIKQLEKRRDNTDFKLLKVIEIWGMRKDGTKYLATRQTLDEKTGEYVTTFDHRQAAGNGNE